MRKVISKETIDSQTNQKANDAKRVPAARADVTILDKAPCTTVISTALSFQIVS